MTNSTPPESRFASPNKVRLHYLDWGNAGAPLLVCVHGFRGNAHSFDGVAQRFRDRFHIVALDVRGRGDSAWAPDGDYHMPAYTADLAGLVDGFTSGRFTLIGTSMGGRIAMHYATNRGDRLERLVLNDIGPESEAGSDRITREAAATPDSFELLEEAMAYRRSTAAAVASLPEDRQRELALTFVTRAADGRWHWKNDLAFLRQRAENGAESYPALWDTLARLTCPTLVVWGTASDVLSEDQARRVVATLPRGVLAKVPGVGHAPTLTEPSSVKVLERFLTTAVPA